MKATKDHISLETAKLLKDCGVESKYMYGEVWTGDTDNSVLKENIIKQEDGLICYVKLIKKLEISQGIDQYPVFTWQEILWEYAEEFFGKKIINTDLFFENLNRYSQRAYERHGEVILHLLQQNKCDKADEYFREHCILINKK